MYSLLVSIRLLAAILGKKILPLVDVPYCTESTIEVLSSSVYSSGLLVLLYSQFGMHINSGDSKTELGTQKNTKLKCHCNLQRLKNVLLHF